ncbi:hypothetical protein KHQ89_07355 [Mycoplasmatota bacterium]|nr:hypothetical protein KHQ89_07355 [Mycoplasmatota bacterium]
MKRKQIEKQIKYESEHVKIPSVYLDIKQKIDHLPRQEVYTLNNTIKRRFSLVYKVSVSFVIVLLISLVLFRFRNADPMDDDSIVEALLYATITSSSYTTDIVNTQTSDEIILLANGQSENDDEIESEANYLTKYLKMMEILSNDTNNYEFTKQKLSALSKSYQLAYVIENIEGESINYLLTYELEEQEDNKYMINGTLIINELTYYIDITYDKENKTLETKTYQNENEYVLVSYHKNDETFNYSVSHIEENDIQESIEISFESKQSIRLSFMNGQSRGTYEFQVETGVLGRKYLQVQYQIGQYAGTMNIRVLASDNANYYFEVITSEGRTFSFTKTRRNNNK